MCIRDRAKTDHYPLPSSLEEVKDRPEALNLLSIVAALIDLSTEEVISRYAGKEFSKLKTDLADLIVEKISPISNEIKKLMDDKVYLDSIMRDGKKKAENVADSVLRKVYDVVGFSKT